MAKTYLSVTNRLDTFVTQHNDLVDDVGDLALLNTTVNTDIVGAINSVYSRIDSDLDFRSKISVTDAGGDGSLTYSAATGVLTYTGPSATEVRSKISVTDAGGDGSLGYNSTTGVITYTGPSATEVRAHFSAGTNTTYSAGQFSISDTTIRSKISVLDAGGDGSLSYNNTNGVITYTGPSAAETRAHFSAAGDLTYNSATGQFSVTTFKTTDARAAISVTDAGGDGSLAYNSTTGVITYTGPSATEVRAHFSAGNGITLTSGSIAVKSPTRFRLFDATGATLLDFYGIGSL